MRRLLLLPAAAILLAGCSGASPGDAPPPASSRASAAPSASAPTSSADPCGPDSTLSDEEILAACPDGGEAVASEGSVTVPDEAFVVYPDGMRAEITGVTKGEPTMGNAEPPDDTEVHVTVRLSNTGTEPLPLFPQGTSDYGDTLLYGANRYEATSWFSDKGGAEDAPQRLVPGTHVDIVSTFTLPGSELGTLAFTTTPNTQVYTPYTFTDVQTLLA